MPEQKTKRSKPDRNEGTITTAIHIGRPQWNLLRAAAFARAQHYGGRPSVSKLISELVDRHESELKKEAGKYLSMMAGE